MIDLSSQTGASVGGQDLATCRAVPRAVDGRMSVLTAIERLLSGSQCRVERVDALTYRIVRRAFILAPVAPPRRAPPRKPAENTDESTLAVIRHPLRPSDTPAAVSVAAPPLLNGNYSDLSMIAPHVSGMVVTNLGPGRDKIFLRGVSDSVLTGRTQSTVGLYLDDTPITFNAPDPSLLLTDMARVEVLKGPQGNLYGQGTLSGVVRLVTRRPELGQSDSEFGTVVGYSPEGKPSWRLTGMMNLPVASADAAARLVLYAEKSGGFIKDNTPLGDASNDTDRMGGRLSIRWQPRTSLTVDTALTIQDLHSLNSQYVKSKVAAFGETVNLLEPHENNFRNLAVTVTQTTGKGEWKLALNRLSHYIRTGYDAYPVRRFTNAPTSGALYFDETQLIQMSSLDLTYTSEFGSDVRWLTGLFAAQSNERFTPLLSDIYNDAIFYREVRRDTLQDLAIFGRLAWDFAPGWTASAGLRLHNTRHDVDSQIDHVQLIDYAKSRSVRDSIENVTLSHDVMLSFKPARGWLVYALSADGSRTGGFNTTTSMRNAGPTIYGDDHLQSLELGGKFRSADDRWRVTAAVFQTDWRDIQSDQLRSTGLPLTINVGNLRNTGLEVEGGWQATADLSLQVRLQTNDPNLYRVNPAFPRTSRHDVPYISRYNASLTALWSPVFRGLQTEYTVVLNQTGGAPLNYGIAGPRIWMKGYGNADVSGAVHHGRYTTSVKVTNLLNSHSNSFAYGNPFRIGDGEQLTPLRPQTFWLSVTRH